MRDEHEQFERPKRRTRPRTKDRPDYSNAKTATVVAVDRGRYTIFIDGHETYAVKARPLGRKSVIVGDRVKVVGDTSTNIDALARIVEIEERSTVLRRTADDDDPFERDIVANADQMAVVVAAADPPPRTGLVDRSLIAAFVAGIDPLVIITKTDLADPKDFVELLKPLGVKVITTKQGADLNEIETALKDHFTVLVGHSGVGKSTLVNALVPSAERETGAVNVLTGRGRHTSTSAVAMELPSGGWIVDTPGIRSFGLAHVTTEDILNTFEDVREIITKCPRGCTHLGTEPDCELDKNDLEPGRLASIRRLLAVG